MWKVIILILVISVACSKKSVPPPYTTLPYSRDKIYGWRIDSGQYLIPKFIDTIWANAKEASKFVSSIIFVVKDSTIWVRSKDPWKWTQITLKKQKK